MKEFKAIVFALVVIFIANAVQMSEMKMVRTETESIAQEKISDEVMEVSSKVFARCKEPNVTVDESCLVEESKDVILEEINYTNDTVLENFGYLNNRPNISLSGGNDCEGITIAWIKTLKNFGFNQTFAVLQEKHLCGMVRYEDMVIDWYNGTHFRGHEKYITSTFNCHDGEFKEVWVV